MANAGIRRDPKNAVGHAKTRAKNGHEHYWLSQNYAGAGGERRLDFDRRSRPVARGLGKKIDGCLLQNAPEEIGRRGFRTEAGQAGGNERVI